jgi:hypothetical protein
MREASLDWGEIYERLARRSGRPDPLALAALDRRVRAWTRDDEVAAETCAEVLRTFNLARGGAAFEGFVQGRFVEVARRKPLPPNPLPRARGRGDEEGEGTDIPPERLARCLEELRARNPRHHGALVLLYEDRATVPEAAAALAVDAWTVDAWTVRMLAARARQALVQCLERAERQGAPGDDGSAGERAGAQRGRAGGRRPGRSGGNPPDRRGRQAPRRRAGREP